MQIAQNSDGKEIKATADAPTGAFCPLCGQPVKLRQRKRMNQDAVTYFWRHHHGRKQYCQSREYPNRRRK